MRDGVRKLGRPTGGNPVFTIPFIPFFFFFFFFFLPTLDMTFVVALISKRAPTMLTTPLLLSAVMISLSLIVSAADLSLNNTGVPQPSTVNDSRTSRRHRGFSSIQATAALLNGSGGNATPVKKTNQFLDAQNTIRASVGEPPLVWDHGLARYARNWANGRVYDCKMIHSGGPYGENIFWGSKDRWTPAQIVNMWVDEVQNYDPVTNSCREGEICGHYTQVVWRDSAKVGCTRVSCNNGGMYAICVYDPPGNYIGENPFSHNVW